jgi:hypothetical protein
MDPLSITAGVLSLLSYAIQISSSISDLRSGIKGAEKSHARILGEIKSLKPLLLRIEDAINKPDTGITQETVNILESVIEPCEATLEEICATLNLAVPSTLREKLKFTRRSKDIEKLRLELISHKTAILLALQICVVP